MSIIFPYQNYNNMSLQEEINRVQSIMGIISEDSVLRFKRILPEVDSIVEYALKNHGYRPNNFCVVFYDSNSFINTVISEVADRLYNMYYSNLDDGEKEWANIYNMIVEYIEKQHSQKIKNYWSSLCNG